MIHTSQTTFQRLAEALQKSLPIEAAIPTYLQGFQDVFSKESFDALPNWKVWDHAIDLEPGSKPSKCKVYPLSPNEQSELDSFLQENLRSEHIRPLKSPMASPVFFIKKKDVSLWLCYDLNLTGYMRLGHNIQPLTNTLATLTICLFLFLSRFPIVNPHSQSLTPGPCFSSIPVPQYISPYYVF